jgi:hypothetical protein
MRTVYRPLIQVHLRHSFYTSGRSLHDFTVEPSRLTRRLLADHGFIFRRIEDGWAIYCEIEPDSDPWRLLRPLEDQALRMVFLLQPANPYLSSISDLPSYRPGRSVFYLSNLRDDQEDGRLLLGDSNDHNGARIGQPARLVTGSTFTYSFADPVDQAELSVVDLFGNEVLTESVSTLEKVWEHRLDLGRLIPGRYTVKCDCDGDNCGGDVAIYHDPEIFSDRPLAVVEILSRTDTLTEDGTDHVPDDYRFLDGDLLTKGIHYTLQLERRATIWRYVIAKKYSTNGFDLKSLSIVANPPVDFHRLVEPENDRAIFTSNDLLPLMEARRDLVLKADSNHIRDLPSPTATTPLKADEGVVVGSYVSEKYLYV